MRTLGIIAGAGPSPVKAVTDAKRSGFRVIYIPLKEVGAEASDDADVTAPASLIKTGTVIQALSENKADAVLLVGKFDKGLNGLDFSEADEVALAMMMRLPGRADMQIGAVVLEELEARGFPPVSQLEAFADRVAPKGMIVGDAVDPERQPDIDLGLEVARSLAKFDIGQTVVIRQGLVVAVEGAEHSDACILRSGQLVAPPLCVVKVARPEQDFRFDTPAVGKVTLDSMKQAGADLLAIEAGRSLIMDEDFVEHATELGIVVIGV